MNKINIKDYAAVTPFGVGVDSLWQSIIQGKSCINTCSRFDVSNFDCKKVSALNLEKFDKNSGSVIWQLIRPLKEQIISWDCDHLILATTKGEIDLLEKYLQSDSDKKIPNELTLDSFLKKTVKYLDVPDGTLVSAACASSSIAMSYAAEMILSGRAARVCVVGIDIVSKFVFSGFSALQALSASSTAKPFDKERDGLIPGEACGAVLLTDDKHGDSKGSLTGWGRASDANHVTGPSRDGGGLADAIIKSIKMAGVNASEICGISAHGTGTNYNDAMEMHAFKKVFDENPVSVFSVKGALGHTMGASGIIESIISLKALEEGIIPPTAGFEYPDELSDGWVSNEKQFLKNKMILKTNSGFGGINCSLVFE